MSSGVVEVTWRYEGTFGEREKVCPVGSPFSPPTESGLAIFDSYTKLSL